MRTLFSTAAIAFGIGIASPVYAQKLPNDEDTQIISEYLMPIAFQNIVAGCTGRISADSYILANAEDLQRRFDGAAEDTFEDALVPLVFFLAGEQASQIPPSEIVMLEEDMIRPFAMQVVGGQIGAAMDLDACTLVNRFMEEVDPLPAKRVAGLMGYLVREMVLRPQAEAASTPTEPTTEVDPAG